MRRKTTNPEEKNKYKLIACKKCGKEVPEPMIATGENCKGLCIDCTMDFILYDPEMIKEREFFARISGHISAEDLNKQFTI